MTYLSIVDTYLNELKARYRVESDEDLATKLEVGKSTLATWRRRGAIPQEVYAARLHPDQLDYFWVVRKHLATVLSTSEAGLKMIVQAAMRLGADARTDHDTASWSDWLISHRQTIFEELIKLDEGGRSDERISDDYVNRRLVSLALSGNSGVFAPDMLRKLRRSMQ